MKNTYLYELLLKIKVNRNNNLNGYFENDLIVNKNFSNLLTFRNNENI